MIILSLLEARKRKWGRERKRRRGQKKRKERGKEKKKKVNFLF